ncbi:MAG TPA: serine/threonine-protein kinase [Terriglobia bacterium]|nr:serine/threonine-protein kinase [Terriglobia bacterium]
MTDFATIGRYEILEEIGRGAMGVVYKARDPVMDRVVAVKTIQTVALGGPQGQQYRDRFYREAQAAARLSHPGIVTVYDAGEHDGMPYLVMEFLRGRTLESALSAGERFSFDRIAELGQQLADALGYAHRNGVVHRDVKPANILLTAPDPQAPERAKITDLGIAKLTASQITTTGQLLGTPSFMPPEQFIGIPVDGRSDLFSLGVILYWMATGDKPFSGDTITAVSYKIVHAETISPRKLNPLVPVGFEAVIMKCLEKDPARRYQTGEELAQDLATLRSGGTVIASAPAVSAVAGPSDITLMVGDEGAPAMPVRPSASASSKTPSVILSPSRSAGAKDPKDSEGTPAATPVAGARGRRPGRAVRLTLEVAGIVVLAAALASTLIHRRAAPPAAAPKPAASAMNRIPLPTASGAPAPSPAAPSPGPAAATPSIPAATPPATPPPAAETKQPAPAAHELTEEKKPRLTRAEASRRAKPKLTLPVLKPPLTPAPVAKTPLEVQPPPKPASAPAPAPKPAVTPPPQPVLTPDTAAKLHIDSGHLPESIGFTVLMDGKPFFQHKAGEGSSAEPLLPPGDHAFQVIAAGAIKLGQSNSVRGQFQAKKKKTLRIELRDTATGNTVKKDAKLADGAADYVVTLK